MQVNDLTPEADQDQDHSGYPDDEQVLMSDGQQPEWARPVVQRVEDLLGQLHMLKIQHRSLQEGCSSLQQKNSSLCDTVDQYCQQYTTATVKTAALEAELSRLTGELASVKQQMEAETAKQQGRICKPAAG